MWLGVDYYPEHWPEERWPADAKLMKEAGLTVVRLAEFAWSRLEPEEGKYDFAWLDRAIDVLAGHGIKVVLSTPTAAPPAWVIQRHPDILPEDYTRTPKSFGIRRHYCFNNEHYHEHSKGIAGAMAGHYCGNPAVIGWQTDNELGCHDTTRCYCKNCAAAFRRWLRARYGSLADLNEAWGTVFWSQEYNEWEQIPLPWKSVESQMAHNPSLLLDFYRFSSDSVVAFQKMQIDILRDLCPRHFITHNLMGLFDQVDYFDLAADLDFVSWDNYPNYSESSPHWTGMSHDVMRGLRACNFWVMEQQSGAVGWNTFGSTPRPGLIRLWTYQAIAHGADAVLYFRWRTSRFGTEQFWHGILDHHGRPGRRYDEVKQIGAELAKHSHEWIDCCPRNEIAFVLSYQQGWAFHVQPQHSAMSYWHELYRLYEPLREFGAGVDFISPEADFSRYKLIVAPLLFLMDPALARRLKTYVEKGGVLVGTFRSGVKDSNNVAADLPLPGLLADIFGISIIEYDSMKPGLSNSVVVDETHLRTTARIWADVIEPGTASVLARYTGDFYAGKGAVTVNTLGSGRAYYIGTALEPEFYAEFFKAILDQCAIATFDSLPEGVEASVRCNDGARIVFLVNPFREPAPVTIDGEYVSLLDEKTVGPRVTLPGYGVMVLKEIVK